MRIHQATDNGNVAAINRHESLSNRIINNSSWHTSNSTQSDKRCSRDRLQYTVNSNNCNNYEPRGSQELFENNSNNTNSVIPEHSISENTDTNTEDVCNRQYRIYNLNNTNIVKSYINKEGSNLAGSVVNANITSEIFLEDSNAYPNTSPSEEERAFEHSDTDEMSENGLQALPRGIVNPNYPGFQHLAHTLQDYSSTIENFYHSENEMTDDDLDIEITELAYENESNEGNTFIENKNINNNNNNDYCNLKSSPLNPSQNDLLTKLDSNAKNDIPDLIKTITKNNNNATTLNCDFNCSDTDIENNFHTQDIIGDFNKEIEDEIKQLLNYNINIQDDLEELRKDIKDTFAKPIENTINNISEVVNHVIKKLVKTKCDSYDQAGDKIKDYDSEDEKFKNESDIIDEENESNTRTEMSLSRPTFLLIENRNTTIVDAHLSDGKDEIDIDSKNIEYNTDKLSNEVENTIKQLSTELRKIIPKLDEMRERDKIWAQSKIEPEKRTVVTDGNSNEVANSSCHNLNSSRESNPEITSFVGNTSTTDNYVECRSPLKAKPDSRGSRDCQKEISSPKDGTRTAQNDLTVHKNSPKECYLGSFDVYNIETALPKLDLDAIENHIKAAKEAERRDNRRKWNTHNDLALNVTMTEKDVVVGKDLTANRINILLFMKNTIRSTRACDSCAIILPNILRLISSKMFESLVTNIRRKLSKTSDETVVAKKSPEKPGFKRRLQLFKSKLLKTEPVTTFLPACSDNTALSPRATGTAECAETEIEWPVLIDNNPNILEKFTRIVTLTDYGPDDSKKRNDREEIRRRLAMGIDNNDEYYSLGHTDRPGKKPSLHSRLQNGMNLQICFMNETASDNESQSSDIERNTNSNSKSSSRTSLFSKSSYNHPYQTRPLSVNITKADKIATVQSVAKLRPSSLSMKTKSRSSHSLGHIELKESDFYALQATLQTEARMALAQAKEMARIQMERERRSRAVSPVTQMLRRSMEKASAPLAPDRRRVSRQLLTDMNIAQLQVIVNELHSQIESLNDSLVKLLMARDELHMGQDSMLVDIEDLTRYLGVKEQSKKTKGAAKSGVRRLSALVHK